MGLTAVTLLGDNTVPILDDLCQNLGRATGLDVTVDEPRPGPSGAAADRLGDADLIWACGYLMCDLVDSGRLDAEIVAAPIFAGEREAVYHSVIVTANPAIRSLDDAGGSRLAINEPISWSGHRGFGAHLTSVGSDLSVFGRVVETGSHRASVEAVAGGDADLAAIDHTVWEHLAPHVPVGADIRVIGRTRDFPAPPFAVRRRISTDARRALVAALVAISTGVIGGLAGVVPASRIDYAVMAPLRR